LQERAEIVKSGHWLYDGIIRREVWIVRQNFEYYYEEGFDDSERLNANGESFAVIYADDGSIIGGPSERLTLDDAIAAAEQAIPQGIDWDNHRLQTLFGGRRYLLTPPTD
jgi:hypothetical protein